MKAHLELRRNKDFPFSLVVARDRESVSAKTARVLHDRCAFRIHDQCLDDHCKTADGGPLTHGAIDGNCLALLLQHPARPLETSKKANRMLSMFVESWFREQRT
ncbi:MAG TPA: hypothetical protein VE967_19595 [Gemmatimonadaceae bacterium]|nr:hypothetical protein [Gemmatimonadaceae bacterium]